MAEEPKKSGPSGLSRQSILRAFQEMSDQLERRGTAGELCLFGGTVMVLAFAARAATDVSDIVFLIRHLKLESATAVMDIVAAYYPQVPVKAQYLVEGLFEEGKL